MSINSGLTRDKTGALLRDGKPVVLGCDTGDDTPVIQDERLDVDLNRLVSNEMARQEMLRIPGQHDYADLTGHPASRGEAEHLNLEMGRRLAQYIKPGESLEEAIRRVQTEQAEALAKLREQNAKTPPAPPAPVDTPPPPPGSQDTPTPQGKP